LGLNSLDSFATRHQNLFLIVENKMKKLLLSCCCLLALIGCKPPNAEPKYLFKTIKADLPYTDWKKNMASAQKRVKYETDFYSKDACRRIAYGWTLYKTKASGQMSCEETAEGFHCRIKDIELECRQLTEKY